MNIIYTLYKHKNLDEKPVGYAFYIDEWHVQTLDSLEKASAYVEGYLDGIETEYGILSKEERMIFYRLKNLNV